MSESKKQKVAREEKIERPPKRRLKSICVFGESDAGKDEEFKIAANALGLLLADKKINFVYGGGVQGLRGSAAISAAINGTQVMSVRI